MILGGLLDAVLDRSIVFSFDRTGYLRHRERFRPGDLDVDLSGRIVLVTGANSGIGLATATALASLKAEVWLLCRNSERGELAAEAIRSVTGSTTVNLETLDVSCLADVRSFAVRFPRPRVDVLVNNAGVLPDTLTRTEEGLELTLATNLVGPYLLTELLRERLHASPDPRVVTVSSGGMYTQRLEVAALEPADGQPFDGVAAYARTKRAEVVLNELWAADDPRVTYAAMHPGWADTPAVRTSLPRFRAVTQWILRTAAEGADTVTWLAAATSVKGRSGLFWFDREPAPTHLLAATREDPPERAALEEALVRWAGSTSRASGRAGPAPPARRPSAPGRRRRPGRRARGTPPRSSPGRRE